LGGGPGVFAALDPRLLAAKPPAWGKEAPASARCGAIATGRDARGHGRQDACRYFVGIAHQGGGGWWDFALGLGVVTPSPKARSCPRTPNTRGF